MSIKMKKQVGIVFPACHSPSRRQFLGQSISLGAASLIPLSSGAAGSIMPKRTSSLLVDPIGFNGERKDPATGNYHLGNGYRMYNPRLMRFHAADSMSPFGRGGINSYAYGLGDPVNRRDPSGHFAVLSLLIGAIVGAVVGAGVSAAAEGIRAATAGDSFDWKQVGIGAALGFISGGFGAAAQGMKTGVQFGLALGDAVVSGAADYGLNIAAGASAKQAGINASIGAVVGLATFGVGHGIGKLGRRRSGGAKSITFGGNMKEMKIGGPDLYFFSDTYKGGKRLNVAAHGIKQGDNTALLFSSSGDHMSAGKLAESMRNLYHLDDYQSIRTIMCFSGDGGEKAFGKQLSLQTGLPVKSYQGTVTGNFMPEDVFPLFAEAFKYADLAGEKSMAQGYAQKRRFIITKQRPSFFDNPSKWLEWGGYNPVKFN